MRRISINKAAICGALIGCVCMAAFLFYTDRPRSAPMIGYAVEIFAGAMMGAGLFSLLAWVSNLAARDES